MWRAQFVRACHRWLRFATGLFVSLLLAVSLSAQEKKLIRFKDGTSEWGRVVGMDDEKVTLLFEGIAEPIPFPWALVDPASESELRKTEEPATLDDLLDGLKEEVPAPSAPVFPRAAEWTDSGLFQDLAGMTARVGSDEEKAVVDRAREATLRGDFEGAAAPLQLLARMVLDPVTAGDLRRLERELRDFGARSRQDLMAWEWHRAADDLLKARASDKAVSYAEAWAYAEGAMEADLRRRVAVRFGMADEATWKARPAGWAFKHVVNEGSWLLTDPASGNSAGWWSAASESDRFTVLKGLYIRRQRDVLETRQKARGGLVLVYR